jgi:hypothetical protein
MWMQKTIRVALAAILCAGRAMAAAGVVPEPSPEQTLRTYQERAVRQLTDLAEFADQTCIEAELPETSQKGQFCFIRSFSAPHSLVYSPLDFVGDSFVKNNVILRFVRSDVEHVQHSASLAILEENYKFSYKGTENLNGHLLYTFAVKPRHKSADLFKGKILVDPHTSCIVRAAGHVSKSPSWWIKRIDFIQDYAMVGDFALPVRTESVTQVRIIGRVVVRIRHRAYELPSIKQLDSAQATKVDAPTKVNRSTSVPEIQHGEKY